MKKVIMIIAIILISINVVKSDMGPFGGIVTTVSVTNIGSRIATVNSTVELLSGDPAASAIGIAWSTSTGPTTGTHPGGGTSSPGGSSSAGPLTQNFSTNLTGLTTSTLYYVRTYAVLDGDTYYSDEVTFTTVPTLPMWGVIALSSITLLFGGFYIRKMVV